MLLRRVLATMRLRNLPLHRCCNWTLHGFGRRRASAAPAKGQALPVSLETSHDKNTPDRIVSKGGGGRPAACWLYPVRVRTVLAAGAVSASRAVSVQHPPPFLTPAPPRAACPPPAAQTRAPFVRLRGAPAELAADAIRCCARTLNAMWPSSVYCTCAAGAKCWMTREV